MTDWGDELDGETPIPDRSGLLLPEIKTRRQLSTAEAQNIQAAVYKYLAAKPSRRLTPFSYPWCLKLHREMFGNVWAWAGGPRRIDLNFGIPWFHVPSQLANLFADLESWGGHGTPLIEQASLLHYRAVHVHPFLNGNGRWSRMLANIWLRRNDQPVINWPAPMGVESPIRHQYLEAIRHADDGELDPLLELHRRYWGA